jgi:hypothetical protein
MSRPLRICLIASSRSPLAEPFMGSLEAHTHTLARSLRQRGHHVSLFADARACHQPHPETTLRRVGRAGKCRFRPRTPRIPLAHPGTEIAPTDLTPKEDA